MRLKIFDNLAISMLPPEIQDDAREALRRMDAEGDPAERIDPAYRFTAPRARDATRGLRMLDLVPSRTRRG